ncbi:hypothetical protein [Pseudoalteromonas luteoviolacea]|uniref:Uncharacterized protein n=1 Tax=Pseudoalteromonas luteoviolacea H33 TaxID=1365251 RepID=A0A167DE11_9GAMM|nr:hypothetical protein [Pseudoalteromonas luteoviolacea]KZN48720.1 hypothetical protein N476_21130 [Pseudoalteromonas luteoviolacea H33]KZN75445.1 hypothetical protein N477_01655 [Pseudoalteromonas luteoviolacea H33-S]MBQ4878645.1 hypothetical protein [Pseudoalteromonas luteoviolacea]MBQ4907185.1 hypothetical protein [Pseudoalteromonas luteoviolacea]
MKSYLAGLSGVFLSCSVAAEGQREYEPFIYFDSQGYTMQLDVKLAHNNTRKLNGITFGTQCELAYCKSESFRVNVLRDFVKAVQNRKLYQIYWVEDEPCLTSGDECTPMNVPVDQQADTSSFVPMSSNRRNHREPAAGTKPDASANFINSAAAAAGSALVNKIADEILSKTEESSSPKLHFYYVKKGYLSRMVPTSVCVKTQYNCEEMTDVLFDYDDDRQVIAKYPYDTSSSESRLRSDSIREYVSNLSYNCIQNFYGTMPYYTVTMTCRYAEH